ncbi:MAG: pyrimidine reductase family protein [Microlunatus sp.]|nr:pyrimidine reductase family protein [Microlunatus sp.]
MSTYHLLTGGKPAALDDAALSELYAHPDPGDHAWVRTNFVSTLDGAVQGRDGRSGTINTPSDRLVFALLRTHADVVLVGAGTVRAEQYRAVDLEPWQLDLRSQLGLAPYPTLAIVTGSGDLDHGLIPDRPCGPVLILTGTSSQYRPEFGPGVGVLEFDEPGRVPVPKLINALSERGLRRVLCEGGPRLNRQLHAAGLVDDLCLTLSPLVVGGDSVRSTVGPRIDEDHFRLEHAIGADDSALLLRYLRR